MLGVGCEENGVGGCFLLLLKRGRVFVDLEVVERRAPKGWWLWRISFACVKKSVALQRGDGKFSVVIYQKDSFAGREIGMGNLAHRSVGGGHGKDDF